MALLKICTVSRTQWLPDVRSVERLSSFDTPPKYRMPPEPGNASTARQLAREKEKALVDAACKNCGDAMGAAIQIVEFWSEEVGVVLRVKQHGCEDKIWVVPDRSCFLMSESGKTLDRI